MGKTFAITGANGFIAAHRTPLDAARARAKSQRVIQAGDQTRFLPSERAVAGAVADGVGRLVFGHIHRRSAGNYGETEYLVLPAFDEHGGGLLVEPGRCAPVRFAGGGAPEDDAEDGDPGAAWAVFAYAPPALADVAAPRDPALAAWVGLRALHALMIGEVP